MFDPETTYPLQCDSCGENLTRAEEEDPCVIKVYYESAFGVIRFHKRVMCDRCASDFILSKGKGLRPVSDMTKALYREHVERCYNDMHSSYPFRSVKHI